MPTPPRNVADDPAYRPGDERAGGAWKFEPETDQLYDADEAPQRLSAAIDDILTRLPSESVAAVIRELSSLSNVYKSALEAIFEYSRPDIVQPPNWHRTIYDIAEAALSDPPREIPNAVFGGDSLGTIEGVYFYDATFPSAAEISSALSQVFSREADDGRNTGLRPTGGRELTAWNWVINHFEAFAASPRTARAVLEELRKNR